MKIVCVSDTHEAHDELEIPDGDVFIHAGDATYMGTVQAITKFNSWLGKLPHKHKIIIAGNHDWLFQTDPGLAKSLITNAIYLQDSGCEIDGIKFWGSPHQPWFYDWAFNQMRGPDIKRYWDLIPTDTDVLITHGPPYGVGDITYRAGNVGCQDLLDAVRKIKPKLHVYGHIHPGYGSVQSLGTIFVNASIMDDLYMPRNEPIVVEL